MKREVYLTHKELVELIIRKNNLYEGIWSLSIKFGFTGSNVEAPGRPKCPGMICVVESIGICEVDEVDNLSVDAAKINPRPSISNPFEGLKEVANDLRRTE